MITKYSKFLNLKETITYKSYAEKYKVRVNEFFSSYIGIDESEIKNCGYMIEDLGYNIKSFNNGLLKKNDNVYYNDKNFIIRSYSETPCISIYIDRTSNVDEDVLPMFYRFISKLLKIYKTIYVNGHEYDKKTLCNVINEYIIYIEIICTNVSVTLTDRQILDIYGYDLSTIIYDEDECAYLPIKIEEMGEVLFKHFNIDNTYDPYNITYTNSLNYLPMMYSNNFLRYLDLLFKVNHYTPNIRITTIKQWGNLKKEEPETIERIFKTMPTKIIERELGDIIMAENIIKLGKIKMQQEIINYAIKVLNVFVFKSEKDKDNIFRVKFNIKFIKNIIDVGHAHTICSLLSNWCYDNVGLTFYERRVPLIKIYEAIDIDKLYFDLYNNCFKKFLDSKV